MTKLDPWIKVKTVHILDEYSDLTDKEFRAWIKLMALCCRLEHIPTQKQMTDQVHYKTIESLNNALKTRQCTLNDIFNDVLKDVQCMVRNREHQKQKMQEYRAKKAAVTGNVTVTLPSREEKRREEKIINIIPPISPKGDLFTDEFVSFWKAYPKKTGKKAAWKAWRAAKDRPPISEIISAISKQSQSEQWQKDGGQYIPNPSTWLNQGRWADELTEQTTSTIDDWARRKQAELEGEE